MADVPARGGAHQTGGRLPIRQASLPPQADLRVFWPKFCRMVRLSFGGFGLVEGGEADLKVGDFLCHLPIMEPCSETGELDLERMSSKRPEQRPEMRKLAGQHSAFLLEGPFCRFHAIGSPP